MSSKINLEEIKKRKTTRELLEFGIINLDKPVGPTSFQTGELVGKMLGLRKFSHAGTLDPNCSGVLPIMLNRACKLLGWFMKKKKTYIGIMKIHKEINEKKLREEIKKFTGKIMQLPPVKSRVKRELREREVYSWDILEINKENREVLFKAEVEAGTYIRKLISDLGEKIGGSHMTELRRTEAGIFKETDKNFINLYELEKIAKDEEKLREIIIPGEIIAEILPVVFVKEENLKQFLTGKPLMKSDIEKGEIKEEFCVFSGNRFVGVYKKVNSEKSKDSLTLSPKRLAQDEGDIIARSEWILN